MMVKIMAMGKLEWLAMQWTEALEDEKEERFVPVFCFIFAFLSCTQMAKKKKKSFFSFDFSGKETVRGTPWQKRQNKRKRFESLFFQGITLKKNLFSTDRIALPFYRFEPVKEVWEERNAEEDEEGDGDGKKQNPKFIRES